MIDEITFRMFLAIMLTCAGAIRAYHGMSSKRSGSIVTISENRLIMTVTSDVCGTPPDDDHFHFLPSL